MPADPMRRAKPGDKFQPSARLHNMLIDSLKKRVGAAADIGKGTTPVEIQVRNSTGESLDRFSVVAINTPSITYAKDPNSFLILDVMEGEIPTSDSVVVITQRPLSASEIGPARLLGLARVRVDLTDTEHLYAGPTTSTEMLTSGESGIARILWVESDTDEREIGEQWAVVLLLGTTTPDNEPEPEDCTIKCGWVAGLLTTDCLNGTVVFAGGRCETDTDTAWEAEFEWNGTDEVWDSDPLLPLEIGNVDYLAHFLRDHDPDGSDPSVGGDPQLYLTLASGSGSTKWWATLDCCGEDYAIFAIGGDICTGDTTCGESRPSQNITRIRVDYQQCTSDGTSGWAGAGWYCVTSETGTVTDSEGPNHGDTAVSTSTAMSEVTWTTPSNASATDTTTTSAIGTGGLFDPTRTQALEVTDFDFSTLTGELTEITVTVRKSRGSGGMGGASVVDYMLCLIVDGVAVTSVNKADTVTAWGSSLADATYTFNAADIVSVGLTLAKLKQSNFGVQLQADFSDSTARASVDSITVTAEAESEPCDNTTCVYLPEDPGVCEEDWTDYFRICAGPFPTQALCQSICELPDPDDEPPLDPVNAQCQGVSFATATAVMSNGQGGMAWVDGVEMTISSAGIDAVTASASGSSAGLAGFTLSCSGGAYLITQSTPAGECGTSDTADSHTASIVFFNADPFVLVIDSTATFSGGSCGSTTAAWRTTITIP